MAVARRTNTPPAVVRRSPALDRFAGKWVAVKAGEVVAAADTSRDLAYQLYKLGDHSRGAVMRFVAEPSSAVMVGLG